MTKGMHLLVWGDSNAAGYRDTRKSRGLRGALADLGSICVVAAAGRRWEDFATSSALHAKGDCAGEFTAGITVLGTNDITKSRTDISQLPDAIEATLRRMRTFLPDHAPIFVVAPFNFQRSKAPRKAAVLDVMKEAVAAANAARLNVHWLDPGWDPKETQRMPDGRVDGCHFAESGGQRLRDAIARATCGGAEGSSA